MILLIEDHKMWLGIHIIVKHHPIENQIKFDIQEVCNDQSQSQDNIKVKLIKIKSRDFNLIKTLLHNRILSLMIRLFLKVDQEVHIIIKSWLYF